MRFLDRFVGRRHVECHPDTIGVDPRAPGFENDYLRFYYDALLAEYEALRREMELKLQQLERAFTYLYITTAGVLFSQFLSEERLSFVNNHPWIYLAAALAFLWFPTYQTLIAADLAMLASYLGSILSERLNAIAVEALGRSDAGGRFIASGQHGQHAGPLFWEAFRAGAMTGQRRTRALFRVLGTYRFAALFGPSGLLLALYSVQTSDDGLWSESAVAPDLVLLAIIGLIWVGLVVAFLLGSNLFTVYRALRE